MKKCKRCGQLLPEDEFYSGKNICVYCHRRKQRTIRRIQDGRTIKTVAELMAELRSFPPDAEIALSDDISLYHPSLVEYVRDQFKGNKDYDIDLYNNVLIIV